MRIPAYLEIPRGIFATTVSSVLGSITGTLFLVGFFRPGNILRGTLSDLFEAGLSMLSFTAFGAIAILLPVYLFFKDRGGSPRKVYSAVAVSGALGASTIMLALAFALGGMIAGRMPIRFMALGIPYGLAIAFWWIAAHHVSRSRRSVYRPISTEASQIVS